MNEINNYVKANEDRFLDELFELIRIPSISSLPEHKEDMYRAAEKWKEILLAAGADKAEVIETNGNPVTYGEKIIDPDAPTVMVYAHMDVMPVDPLEKWKTDPFEPVVKDGKIWARGADDDKGQSFMHAKAFEYLVKSGKLECNVKFLIEGEEEIGSPNLPDFCEKHKEMLKADIILVSDTSMIAPDVPSITTGLRGLAYWQVEVTGPNIDLHSGLFGGAVANPINVLSKMIAQTMDDDGRILIPGFYDDVVEVSAEERAKMAKAPFSLDDYKKSLDLKEVFGEKGYSTNERTGIRPTFDVCGIWGGYTGEGAKTVLPSKAYAKISTRLVPNQDHNKIAKMFVEYFESIAPEYVTVKAEYLHGGPSYVCPIDLPAYKAAEKAFKDVYGKDPVPVRSGGSIPIIATFEEVLGIKSVLMGFGLGSDAIHSPNENFPLEQFYNGIRTIPLFYKYFAEEMKK
ncbi:MAG TPA: dipeptidase [Fermentimonas caenicola]|jgi:acetylornithine deacetylase/succinyl-diaminopimelate desuccinylase-like protein|uniref:dipeptidase n=1 Tax=Lascolabacillus TaxID=1924067 RepID=UPI0006B33897|nr:MULTISPECIES: dipeptidase [Lascolabacillus]MBP6175800.1 dipeptidase [Fermentimonas sp.]TAH62115.1 MAG: dipeptidase [Fermentimonas caenicola]MBP6196204.1 dipeptidase [Fermentimonas sp.]MCK9501948.1 dipeptidase [Lascolabacillus sp.]MDD2607415.1 dipeptidase [Lascolabacillus sp.]